MSIAILLDNLDKLEYPNFRNEKLFLSSFLRLRALLGQMTCSFVAGLEGD
jgi:hypothetical protein